MVPPKSVFAVLLLILAGVEAYVELPVAIEAGPLPNSTVAGGSGSTNTSLELLPGLGAPVTGATNSPSPLPGTADPGSSPGSVTINNNEAGVASPAQQLLVGSASPESAEPALIYLPSPAVAQPSASSPVAAFSPAVLVSPVLPNIEVDDSVSPAIEASTSTGLGGSAVTSVGRPTPAGGFIRVVDGRFVDDKCQEFVPFGYNWWSWPVINKAIEANQGDKESAEFIDETFRTAANASFNTFRLFAHGVDYGIQLNTAPGVYNETVFRAIDYVLAKAKQYNLRVVISTANWWQHDDGFFGFVDWAGIPQEEQFKFYSDPTARKLFRDHITFFANRVNHFTGVAYKADPTIFAYNLMNEPRGGNWVGPPAVVTAMTSWVDEMTKAFKAAAPRTMVSVGSEAFFAQGSGMEYANPYGSTNPGGVISTAQFWAGWTGQDAFTQTMYTAVDYLSMHMWPDNWNTRDFNWATAWLTAQYVVASRTGKPLFMEEFGKVAETWDEVASVRNVWYNFWMHAFVKSLATNAPMRGATLWIWDARDISEANMTAALGLNVYTGDPTWNLLQQRWVPQLKATTAAIQPPKGCAKPA